MLASVNYHVIITSRSTEKGQIAVDQILARNPLGTLSYLHLDVVNQESINEAVEEVEKKFGHLDILINNAGLIDKDSNLLYQMRNTFETNTFGAAMVTYAFVELLKKSTDPRLLYISSGLGSITMQADLESKTGGVSALTYRMSKAALNMLAASNFREFQAWGCKVWSLSPGFVVTNLGGGGAHREMLAKRGAGSSETSAQFILAVVKGERDEDNGKFIHSKGIHPW